MKNNPHQEIHTDYRANDIFKPINANRLAESIHYDFVITQEMLDKYMEKNPGDTEIGIGLLLNSNSDGTRNSTYAILAKAPVSVFIAAKTPDNVVYDFTQAFMNTSSTILDISDFLDNGQYTVDKTDGAVDVYSEYPYRANITGGVNYHSTPKAPLTVGIVQNNGVIRIGAYKTIGSSPINVFRYGSIKIITQEKLGGYGFADVLSSDTQKPDLFVADWMGGGCSGDLGYAIDATDTVQYGLFDRFAESYSLGTCATLFVRQAQFTSVYHRDYGSSYDVTFSNASEGRKITIHKNGTITKENTSVGGGGGSEKVVLSNFDITAIPLLFEDSVTGRYATSMKNKKTDPATKWDWARICVIRNGASFITVQEDCPDFQGSISFYGRSKTASFKFRGATELDYYTWGAIFAPVDSSVGWGTIKTDQNCRWWTPNNELDIDYDELVDGVIYTVRVHHMLLPFGSLTNPTGSTAQANLFSQDKDGSHLPTTCVYFCKDTYLVPPNYWGSTGMGIAGNTSYVNMNLVKQTCTYDNASSSNGGNALAEVARGEMLFVKLNGSIYVMKY